MPIGIPGCPEAAASTASTASIRTASAIAVATDGKGLDKFKKQLRAPIVRPQRGFPESLAMPGRAFLAKHPA